jgi:hypothetical protein
MCRYRLHGFPLNIPVEDSRPIRYAFGMIQPSGNAGKLQEGSLSATSYNGHLFPEDITGCPQEIPASSPDFEMSDLFLSQETADYQYE